MNNKVRTVLYAFLTWFIPMAVSMLLYDQETDSYLPNFPVFKTLMLAMLFLLTYLFYKKLKGTNPLPWVTVALIFTLVCSVFDFVVLIGMFKMEISLWLMAIFPFYILSFFVLGYFVLRK